MTSLWPLRVVALTPAACGSVLWQRGGARGVTVVVKATFGLVHEASARLAAPAEIVREDRYRSGTQSLEAASDLAPYLPGTGVVLTGHAHAPPGRPAPALSIRLGIFRDRPLLEKTLHVLGYRAPNAPQKPWPFQDVPIVYERAFGGPGVDENPVGTGAVPGSPLPNIVDPNDARRPAGLGPIARRWAPRRRLLGGADPAALDRAVAEIPDGLDWRYFHAAPADQQIEMLRGDEWIVLDGMHATLPRVQSRLPSPRAEVRWHLLGPGGAGPGRPIELCADTLVIDAEALTASMVWRGHVLVDPPDMLARMRVFAGVEMPGYPISWPDPDDIATAAPAAPRVLPASVGRPVISISDHDTDEATTVVATAAALRDKLGEIPPDAEIDDPLLTTGRIDLRKANQPALPFRQAPPREGPRFEEQGPRPTTRGLGNTAPNAQSPFARRDVLPFKPSEGSRPSDFHAPAAGAAPAAPFAAKDAIPFKPASAPVPSLVDAPPPGDFEDPVMETKAIDLRALSTRSNQLAPFALATPGAKPDAPRAAIPGAPWSRAQGEPAPIVEPPPPDLESTSPDARAPFAAPPPASPWASGGSAPPHFDPAPPGAPPMSIGERAATSMSIGERGATSTSIGERAATSMSIGERAAASSPLAEPPPVAAPPIAPPPPVTLPSLATPAEEPPKPVTGAMKPVRPAANAGARERVVAALAAQEPFDGIDLAGADLSDLDLSGRSLIDQNLRGANLGRANLAKASLMGAQLVEADLTEAVLTGANLANADLSRATLARAKLDGAQLNGANFTGAQGPGANLGGARGERPLLVRSALGGAIFDGAELTAADFSGATLDGASFRGATLRSIRLDGARGMAPVFDGAKMLSASGEGVELTKPSFAKAEAEGSNWDRATLAEAIWTSAKLKGASLLRAAVDRADFSGADLAEAKLQRMTGEGVALAGANLEGADLRRATLPSASLDGAKFAKGWADKADLSGARFTRADLRGTSLRGAILKGAVLAHAQLDGADLRDADLEQANLFQADRKNAKTTGANLKDVREVDPDRG